MLQDVAAELLERNGDVAAVETCFSRLLVTPGSGTVVVVEGPPGIGKTALLGALAARARQLGIETLAARAGELERGFAFSVLRQLFERRLTLASRAERRRLLAGAAGLAVPAVSPQPSRSMLTDTGENALFGYLHGTYWLCANLAARSPLMLTIDDVQWADTPSLHFCHYLVRRIAELPVLLVLAARSFDQTLLVDLKLNPSTCLITPRPLSEAAVMHLARGAVGAQASPALAATCHLATGGNPFLVQELLRWMATQDDPGTAAESGGAPPSVQASVRQRLERLSPSARRLAHAAAILDSGTALAPVIALAELDPGDVPIATAELVEATILASPSPIEFLHPLVRSAILSGLPATQREMLHRQAARTLLGAGEPTSVAASHVLATPIVGEPWALETLADAARAALAAADPASAVAWLNRALHEPVMGAQRAELLRMLATAEQRMGDPAATAHLWAALGLSDDPVERAMTLRPLLLGMLAAGHAARLPELLETLYRELADQAPDLAVQIEAEVLSAARHTLSSSLWIADRLRAWHGRARPTSPGGRLLLASLATLAALDGDPARHAADLAEQAWAGGLLLTDQTADAMPSYQVAWQLIAAERLDLARAILDRAEAEAQGRGSVVGFAVASLFQSYVDLAVGDVAGAEARAVTSLDAARQAGWFGVPAVVAAVVDVLIEQDRLTDAQQLLEETGFTDALPDSTPYRLLLYSRGLLRLAAGDAAEAAADLLELVARERRCPALSSHLVPHHCAVALALRATGDLTSAAVHARVGVDQAQAWGAPRIVARALRVRAILAPPEQAVRDLACGLHLLESSASRLDEAWLRVSLGAVLHRAGERAQARAELEKALDLGHRCRAARVQQAARAELIACGYRPRRMAVTGVAALTGSEHRVAEMAANGLTNREIAQGLFVGERTVEVHLTHAYQKLGITSRRGLGAALREQRRQ